MLRSLNWVQTRIWTVAQGPDASSLKLSQIVTTAALQLQAEVFGLPNSMCQEYSEGFLFPISTHKLMEDGLVYGFGV